MGVGPTAAAVTSAPATVRHDVTFMSMLVPHHETAIRMATVAQQRAAVSQVRALAARIIAAQTAEIRQIRNWLQRHGARPMTDPPAVQQMNSQDLEMLRSVPRTEVDRMFLMMMRMHHAQAVSMAIDELQNGKNREALDLAQSVKDDQSQEILTMNRLLRSLGR
ncbi:DUF305 domain-containing protein [Nonomuraea sp. NPDC049504]|uniref:DUF305 domain-containing protein n=1 Tax=Nonomuraea sp. NPDC049504 TaxID=3154729 RepID=UPI0034405BAD